MSDEEEKVNYAGQFVRNALVRRCLIYQTLRSNNFFFDRADDEAIGQCGVNILHAMNTMANHEFRVSE